MGEEASVGVERQACGERTHTPGTHDVEGRGHNSWSLRALGGEISVGSSGHCWDRRFDSDLHHLTPPPTSPLRLRLRSQRGDQLLVEPQQVLDALTFGIEAA